MKFVFIYLLFFTSFKLHAIDSTVFDDKYPGFQTYQEIIFSKVKTYFETLEANSLIQPLKNGLTQYRIMDIDNEDEVVLHSTIKRIQSPNVIVERIMYSNEKGNRFEVVIEKHGTNVVKSDDHDLLTFHFNMNNNDESYQIAIPALGVQLYQTQKDSGFISSFNVGVMDFVIKIESSFQAHTALQTYFYFIKEMPNPQSSLAVKAIEKSSTWNDFQFIHISSQSGEITPAQFSMGLNSGAQMLTMAADMIFKSLDENGFPTLIKEE